MSTDKGYTWPDDDNSEPDPSTTYKGHPQPPVNERLASIKIFLADEDPDRCLFFASQFAQIKEYTAHIEANNIPHDARLLKDITVMQAAHDDWLQQRNAGLPRLQACQKLPPRTSTRLVDASTSATIEERRNTLRDYQMRSDAPPFTPVVDKEQLQFLAQLAKDTTVDLDDVADLKEKGRENNLLHVAEIKAYAMTMRDPAKIPVWLHPLRGVVNKGIVASEGLPWYMQPEAPTEVELSRPSRASLPDYLIERENEINRLLKKKKLSTKLFLKLEGLLRFHEPWELRRKYLIWQKQERTYDPARKCLLTLQLKDEYETAQQKWFNTFRLDGVFLMEENKRRPHSTQPGVFYVPGEDAITESHKLNKLMLQDRVNSGLAILREKGSYKDLAPELQSRFAVGLFPYKPTAFSHVRTPDQLTENPSGFLSARWGAWIESLAVAPQLDIRLLRPGEMIPKDPKTISIVWEYPLPQDEDMTVSDAADQLVEEIEVLVDQRKDPKLEVVDFISKAEYRGVQRAAIEIALSNFATNQEQHRPLDKFRILKLPAPYQGPKEMATLSIPLEPCHRPIEQDPFKYSKAVSELHQWNDFNYSLGRKQWHNKNPGTLIAPANHRGPFLAANGDDVTEAIRLRQSTLNSYYAYLSNAERAAPRPLLQLMLNRATEALTSITRIPESPPLSKRDLDLFEELCGPSWDEHVELCSDDILDGDEREKQRFFEFEADVNRFMDMIPWWQDPAELIPRDPTLPSLSLDEQCKVRPYIPTTRSARGMPLRNLRQIIREDRIAKDPNAHMWTNDEFERYLDVMSSFFHRIHFDTDGEEQVARVPFIGHPENKYVWETDRIKVADFPGVHYKTDTDLTSPRLEVRYNAEGLKGPPICQPNRNEHFMSLASRLGYEIRKCLEQRARPEWTDRDCDVVQWTAIAGSVREMHNTTSEQLKLLEGPEPVSETLTSLAEQLDQWAPDLADEAGFNMDKGTYPTNGTDREKSDWQSEYERNVAALLQMQILEEINNNWEFRYPEDEHVWDFASERVEPYTYTNSRDKEVITRPKVKQFFSMMRWPVACQSEEMQKMITTSGPDIQSKPPEPESAAVREARMVDEELAIPPGRKVRHIKDRAPDFPFGETTMQRAWESHKITGDLRGVAEFEVKEPKKWFFQRKPKVTDPNKLPKIPDGWIPDNVSLENKRLDLIKFAKNTPGFPDPRILEYYHTQEEIQNINAYQARQREIQTAAIQAATHAIERQLGRLISESSAAEIRRAQRKLKIDPISSAFQVDIASGRVKSDTISKSRKRARTPNPLDLSGGGPARNTRSKSPLKSGQNTTADEQRPRKKKKTTQDGTTTTDGNDGGGAPPVDGPPAPPPDNTGNQNGGPPAPPPDNTGNTAPPPDTTANQNDRRWTRPFAADGDGGGGGM